MTVTRRQWVAALSAATVPASLRPMKATLLSLAALVTPEGELHQWQEDMAEAAGVPSRTLERHLAHAVAAGWLVHLVRGGHGRRGIYTTTLPGQSCAPHVADNSGQDDPSCAPSVADNSGSCPPSTRGQLRGVVRHPAADSEQIQREQGEHEAVDRDRGRRDDHDGAGVSLTAGQSTGSTDDGVSDLLVVQSRPGSEADGRGGAGGEEPPAPPTDDRHRLSLGRAQGGPEVGDGTDAARARFGRALAAAAADDSRCPHGQPRAQRCDPCLADALGCPLETLFPTHPDPEDVR